MIILGTNSIKDTGYDVANSCRFDDGSSDNLTRTPSSASNKRTFTMSFWLKRSNLTGSTKQTIFSAVDSNVEFFLWIDNERFLIYATNTSGALTFALQTTQLLRDISSFYNIVIAIDTTQGTDTNRAKIFINGNQVSDFTTYSSASKYPAQNYDTSINTTNAHTIGIRPSSSMNMDGYLCEFCLIDGSQLDATSFGETDSVTNNWVPKDVSGLTFGNNGFYLPFTNASALGEDFSGNDNDFTANNLTSLDQSVDTCTNNFSTLNALHRVDGYSFAQGNLEFTNSSSEHRMTNSSIAVSQGKWYAEVKIDSVGQSQSIGVINPDNFLYSTYFHNAGRGYGYKSNDGNKVFNDSVNTSYGNSYTTGDIIGIAMDLDNYKLYYSKNGTFQNSGDPTSGSTGTGSAFDLATGVAYSFGQSSQDGGTNPVTSWNFGSPPYAISSGNTDGNGYGNFEYAVPSGYYSLNTKNLAEYG